nr:reverse transcriptase domain-containing protein [Tanacetum cinerariifolium]
MESNIRALKTTTKNIEEKAYQLTQTILTNTGKIFKARTIIELAKLFARLESKEIHEIKAQEDKRDMKDGWDSMTMDVERLRQIPTPTIHNLEPVDYDIPLHDGVTQPLTPLTVHITPLDDDYVASATNPILNKHLNEFEEEFSDNIMVSNEINSNPVNNLNELLKTYDFQTFVREILHLVPTVGRLWFRWISFDYRVPLGFGSIAGGLDHVNLVIRLPVAHGISMGTKVDRDDRYRNDPIRSMELKIEIPEFTGKVHLGDFIDWLSTVEQVFDVRDILTS